MSFNYSGDPSTSPLDSVRYLVEDTNPQDPQLQDAEINWLISQHVNIWRSAAYAAKNIQNKYARQIDKSDGDLRLTYSQRQKAYADMCADLLRQAANRTSFPWLGGISHAERQATAQNTDLIKSVFTKNQFHYPEGMSGVNLGQSDVGPADQTD